MEFTIGITKESAEKVKELMQEQDIPNAHLRVWVAGGGCSGLSYGMALDDNEPEENDYLIISTDDVKIVVDNLSAKYMNGSIINWDEDVLGGGFRISNPNATKTCGCSSSFSTDEEGISGLNEGRGCGGCGSR